MDDAPDAFYKNSLRDYYPEKPLDDLVKLLPDEKAIISILYRLSNRNSINITINGQSLEYGKHYKKYKIRFAYAIGNLVCFDTYLNVTRDLSNGNEELVVEVDSNLKAESTNGISGLVEVVSDLIEKYVESKNPKTETLLFSILSAMLIYKNIDKIVEPVKEYLSRINKITYENTIKDLFPGKDLRDLTKDLPDEKVVLSMLTKLGLTGKIVVEETSRSAGCFGIGWTEGTDYYCTASFKYGVLAGGEKFEIEISAEAGMRCWVWGYCDDDCELIVTVNDLEISDGDINEIIDVIKDYIGCTSDDVRRELVGFLAALLIRDRIGEIAELALNMCYTEFPVSWRSEEWEEE